MSAVAPDLVDVSDRSPVMAVEVPEARPSLRRVIGAALSIFALLVLAFCVYEFALSGFMEARSQRFLLNQFRSLTDQGPATTVEWAPVQGQPVAILSIPRLGVQSVVVEGTTSSRTAEGPGHYRGSSLPGRPGNSVIIGRRTTYGKPFSAIGTLKAGDPIRVTTGVGGFTYTVQSVSVVRPGAADVLGPTPDNRLTLVTSDPAYLASARLVVVALLSGMPASQPLLAPPMLTSSEYGMTGNSAAFGPFLIWVEVLVVALVAAVWMSRRASRRVALFLSAPIVIALLFAIYGALNQLLPATF